jgi:hypothetical protein
MKVESQMQRKLLLRSHRKLQLLLMKRVVMKVLVFMMMQSLVPCGSRLFR